MSSLSTTDPGRVHLDEPAELIAASRPTSRRAPVALAIALLLLVLYAAFENGGIGMAAQARLGVAVAAIAALAAGAGIWNGTLRFSGAPGARVAIGLLVAFAIWSGVSLLWSVAPDRTWTELNLASTYVIVLCLALSVGASLARPVAFAANGILAVALAVTLYALGQKIVPGLHVSGLFDLNTTGSLPRLQDPVGYWNALALFVAIGVPCALASVVDVVRPARARLVALIATQLMLLVVGLTYSRGAVLALVLALAVGIPISRAKLCWLMWLALAVLATLPPLLFGLLDDSLTTTGVSLGDRELAGAELGAILLVSAVALVLLARRLFGAELHARISATRARAIGRLLAVVAGVCVVLAIGAVAFSSRGIGGTISHAWNSFIATRAANPADPSRLVSADSANRWVWWKEAAGAFSDRPVTGWGAGSFAVVHLLYRHDRLGVQQPHSVPLQFLAETGIVGAAIALTALLLLALAAARVARRRALAADGLLAAAALMGGVAYLVHSLYDWDWDIPAVTLPALLLLGVLAGVAAKPRTPQLHRLGPAVGVGAVAGLTLWLFSFALSSALPSIAATEASSALVLAGDGSLNGAMSTAELASRLDPVSDAGLRVEAAVALRLGQVQAARRDLLEAVRREPSDGEAWQSLALVELASGDSRKAAGAAVRSLALDPQSRTRLASALTYSQRARLGSAPPQASATAIQTPSG